MAKQKITPPQIVEEAWIAPTLAGAWVNYGGAFNPAGYMKDSMGFVHLRGLIKSGAATTIFTLPVGYRPAFQELGNTIANGVFTRYDITTAGVLTVTTYSATYTSIDNITFKAV